MTRRGGSAGGDRSEAHVVIVVENESVPSDRRVWLECRALAQARYRVTVVCRQEDGEPLREDIDGIAIHRFPAPDESGGQGSYLRGYALSWLRVARLLRSIWRTDPFDVLQTCNPPDTYFPLAALYKRRGVRYLFDQHDLCPEIYATRFARPDSRLRTVLSFLERRTHRSADHVITVNESVREVLLARTGIAADRLSVVRTGPDLARLRPVPERPDLRAGRRHLCAYLGVMGPQDGVDMVLRAADVVVRARGRSDVHFAIMGFGECLEPLRALCTELGLDDHVTFTGRVGDAEICEYLSTADIGLQPDPKTEFTELCSMVKTIEYMAFGLPVVAYDLRETRRSAGDAASYVTDPTPEAYADAILALLDDPTRRERMGEVGRTLATGPLAWSHHREIYLGIIAGLVGRRRTAALRVVA